MRAEQTIRCLVWDLDDTIWWGKLLDDRVALRPRIEEVLSTLKSRGLYLAVASLNDPEDGLRMMRHFQLEQYFDCIQIHWGSKTDSIDAILRALQLKPQDLAFIDDNPAQRSAVSQVYPEILVLDETQYITLLARDEFQGNLSG